MKKIITHVVLAMLLVLPLSASAENTYLEKDYHYTVRMAGNGVLHFTIPIWVYGSYNDYYLYCSDAANDVNDSYLWYSETQNVSKGSGDVRRAVSFKAERKGLNDENGSVGEGYLRVHNDRGVVILQSTYDGVEQQFNPNDQWSGKLQLKRKNDDDHKRITYLEFDWYPPSELDNKDFYVGVCANIYKKSSGDPCTKCGGEGGHIHWIHMDGQYTGKDSLQSPELFDPYLYSVNADGSAGYGYAAVPYVTYQTPLNYVTSFNSESKICTTQSGTLYVQTGDEIQHNFNATFTVWRDRDHQDSKDLKTNNVDIPAYHRLYDLTATEQKDAQNSMTGKTILRWNIRHPEDDDLVASDFFEIQRALKKDYSDAESVGLVPYAADSASYTYTDDITNLKSDANGDQLKSLTKTYDYYDSDSNRVASFKGSITSTIVESGFPVYYRVRRASSSVWGWENHPFAQTASLIKDAWLAPLAQTQEDYTKDANFDDNRTIHFNLKIDNALVSNRPTPAELCKYDVELEDVYYDLPLTVTSEVTEFAGIEFGNFSINFKTRSEQDWRFGESQAMNKDGNKYSYSVPAGSTVQLYITRYTIPGQISTIETVPLGDPFRMDAPTQGRFFVEDLQPGVKQTKLTFEEDTHFVDSLKAVIIEKFQTDSLTSVKNDLYASLFPNAQTNANDEVRCIWDQNARLIVTKRMIDYGLEQEFYVPQDSIKRQEDGSWVAHITDVADMACTEYEYFARIDASLSVLNFNDQSYNDPIKINGPSLFTTTVANIHTLEATQGTNKQGVVVTWEPTAGSLSDYVLLRRESGTNGDYDTLTITNEGGFHDTTAYPNKHYEYKLVARYMCNSNSSAKEASVEGWRSPYGSIRGRVSYEDGSGCPGVPVTLTADGQPEKIVYTKPDGTYFADSLLYDSDHGSVYSVTPTSQNATFTYNYLDDLHDATVSVSRGRSEVTDIDFQNISFYRLTGRVLYDRTTIPVYGASFKINGIEARYSGSPVTTAHDGTFQLLVPHGAFTLQVCMEGHKFANDGFLIVDGSDTITLEKALDGVRFWDQTTVRLAGRIVGGNDQGKKPLGFGLSKNNLGDDLKMVFELEGDNISYMVHDLHDPTLEERDTAFNHLVKTPNGTDTVGTTAMHLTQKRLVVYPDIATGEYEIDLWPVRYKITQITAKGYATLYAAGQGAATIDLTNAVGADQEVINGRDTTFYQSVFNRIYHSPIELKLTQRGLAGDCDYYGEKELNLTSVANTSTSNKVSLVGKDNTDSTLTTYLFGYPVFVEAGYPYRAEAFEEYFYNNDPITGTRDHVNMHGGTLRIHNGLSDNNQTLIQRLDSTGRANFVLNVANPSFRGNDEASLRTVTVSAEIEESFIEAEPLHAFISGKRTQQYTVQEDTVGFAILDILRDPPGENSYAWLESGASYNFSYAIDFEIKGGLEIGLGFGANVTNNMGLWAGVGAGTYAGTEYEISKQFMVDIPIVLDYKGKAAYTYNFQTNERIATSSDHLIVGSDADIFIGVSQGLKHGQAKAICVIDEATYNMRKPAVDAGSLVILAEGLTSKGEKYYLAIGTVTEIGSSINGTFVYTQHHIINTVLPSLVQERNSLLIEGDSATIQAQANATKKTLYWSHPDKDHPKGSEGSYSILTPQGVASTGTDRIKTLNRMVTIWTNALKKNEEQKVAARTSGRKVGTWSVSGGATQSYTENFAYSYSYDNQFTGLDLSSTSTNLLGSIANDVGGILSEMVTKALGNASPSNAPWEVDGHAPGSKFKVTLKPVFAADIEVPYGSAEGTTKTMGFTLSPNQFGSVSASVYSPRDTVFEKATKEYRGKTAVTDDVNKKQYGSFVFYTEGGASMCPYEGEEKPKYYKKDVLLNNATIRIEDPRLQIDTHERSDVPADKPAIFNLRLSNEGQVENGLGAVGTTFSLTQTAGSNPKGAKIFIDGMPVTGNGMDFFLASGESVNKVMEVYRGEADDYEDIQLRLGSTTCASNADYLTFSVHYLPSSSDVEISVPHDKWIMNTFAAQDSVGYYLPITIEGFDVHHRGFDHIEFQYKLTTQSDDAWINECSFFADKSLYDAASGNKQMITNGRINTLRFYGERDPIEQQYDLRAVTFCRHGSGFVTKSSNVLTGIKDTRPPRVFGNPTPANSVLTVNDVLSLRFNEAIAGNYLDEDNNFQIVGVTNSTGIVSSTSVNFDGVQESYAASKMSRNLTNRSFTVDMVVKPSVRGEKHVLFEHGADGRGFVFGITADNKLYATIGDKTVYSKQMEPLTTFTRVAVSYDTLRHDVHFYAGTQDVTDKDNVLSAYSRTGLLIFGRGYKGNMLEARIWSKALQTAEIAETNMRRLTGYERELSAYYPMDEGKGDILADKANGATLYMHGSGWLMPDGLSLRIPEGEAIELDQDKFARSAIQDFSLMFWFKTYYANAPLLRVGFTQDSTSFSGTCIDIQNGNLVFRHNNMTQISLGSYNNDEWHQYVLAVNHTYNNVSIYVDGKLTNSFAATEMGAFAGQMLLGGKTESGTFAGNIDELVLFEQALPTSMISHFYDKAAEGDEMGIMALLSFEEEYENDNGVIERRFSPNDRRVFKDSQGNVLNKIVPLIMEKDIAKASAMADKKIYAPMQERGLQSKMNFDWAFNHDELVINLNMADREINKQTIHLTVRNVEDLNGNRMVSPVTWTAYVDRNQLKWEERSANITLQYASDEDYALPLTFKNIGGNTHQYRIESLPSWLTVDEAAGTIAPLDEKQIKLTIKAGLAVGTYSDMIYLTDENDLTEPFTLHVTVEAECPWDQVDMKDFEHTMAVCGRVKITIDNMTEYDTDENDIVAAFRRNECVGRSHIAFDPQSGISEVYLTVGGDAADQDTPLQFQLWHASTGTIRKLIPDRTINFTINGIAGCGDEEPVIFTSSKNSDQIITLEKGWNWISTNLKPDFEGDVNQALSTDIEWQQYDQIKNPISQVFCDYYLKTNAWAGTLTNIERKYTYFIYSTVGRDVRISGALPSAGETPSITLYGNKTWSAFPCLFLKNQSITNAMGDYFDKAQAGDMIKSQTKFAVFSQDKKWVGNLEYLRPGEGYLFYRADTGNVEFNYYDSPITVQTPQPVVAKQSEGGWRPAYATNMSVIAQAKGIDLHDCSIKAYMGGEPIGEASIVPIEDEELLFISVSADRTEPVYFMLERNGQVVGTTRPMFAYHADDIRGSLKAPVQLDFVQTDVVTATPNPFTDHVDFVFSVTEEYEALIKLYDMLGAPVAQTTCLVSEQMNSCRIDNLGSLPTGIYTAVVNINGLRITVKLMK